MILVERFFSFVKNILKTIPETPCTKSVSQFLQISSKVVAVRNGLLPPPLRALRRPSVGSFALACLFWTGYPAHLNTFSTSAAIRAKGNYGSDRIGVAG